MCARVYLLGGAFNGRRNYLTHITRYFSSSYFYCLSFSSTCRCISVIGVLSLCQFARGVFSYCTENSKLAHIGQGFFPSLNTSTLVILVVLKMFLSAKLSFRFCLLLLLFKTHLELLVKMNADCETKQFPSEPTP